MNCSQEIWKGVFSRVNNYSNGQNGKVFLHRIITGNEKWIHYDNPKRKSHGVNLAMHQHPQQSHIHGSKLMLLKSAGCHVL